MTKRAFYFLLFILCSLGVKAQIGGSNVYNFLDFSYSSRIAALGGSLISVHDDDPTLINYNPSYISKRHNNSLSLNFTDYFSDVNYGSALYSRSFKKAGSFALEMRYVGYGRFIETDEIENQLGYFSANDLAMTVGWGRQLDSNFSIGANLKMIYCTYESYTSFGLAADVAGSYYNSKKNISLTLLFKNIGSELKTFTPGNYEKTPFDIQFAFSQRFQHLPVRYHISLHSLYKWDMAYVGEDDPFLETDALTGDVQYPSNVSRFFDNFFRHFIFGIEIIPSKYLSIQLAYNHNQHQEMKIPQKNSFAGFSYGFMLNIKSIRVGFSRSHYAVGAVPNYFTFAANIDELAKLSKDKKAKKIERLN